MNKELLIIEEAKKLFIEKGINNTSIDDIKNQAINNNYHSLTMDAMIAFLATERSLTDKADSLNRIKDKLGGN